MQLDRTEVVIRTRTLSELGDLGLRLLHRFPRQLIPVALAGWLPTMALSMLAVGHLLPSLGWPQVFGESWDSLAEDNFADAAGRWAYWVVLLGITLAPWSGVPLTHLLGQLVFEQNPSRREAIAALRLRPGAMFYILGIVRLSAIVVTIATTTWIVGPENYLPEALAGILALLMLAIRGSRPFVVEMLLLERCPLRNDGKALPLRSRSSALHSPLAGELGGRSLTTGAMAVILGASLFYTLVWIRGVLLGQWQCDAIALTVFLPLALWTVLSFCTIVRFLGYLDARIRLEGWEVELSMRAEAIRQFGERADELSESSPPADGKLSSPATASSPPAPASSPPAPASSTAPTTTPASTTAAVICSLAFAIAASTVAASPPATVQPLPAAGDVLDDSSWFDARREQLQPIPLDPTPADEANRRSTWTAKAAQPKAKPAARSLPDLSTVMSWIVLLGLLGLVTAAVVFAMRNAEWAGGGAGSPSVANQRRPLRIDASRMESLPAEVRHLHGDPRAMAAELATRGRFDDAVVRLFGHQLLLLDAAGLIQLRREHTNGVYGRQCRRRDESIAQRLRQTVDAFERSYFGGHSIDETTWRELWDNNERLEASATRYANAEVLPTRPSAAAAALMGLVWCAALSGCGQSGEMPYGGTRGNTASGSLNGLTGLRTILTTPPVGHPHPPKIRDLRTLSERSLRCDAIVWTPTDWPPANLADVSDWLDGWLAQGDCRLVVVLPDGGSDRAYWQSTLELAPPAGKPRHRRRLAQAVTDDLARRLSQSTIQHSRFYNAQRLPPAAPGAPPTPTWAITADNDDEAATQTRLRGDASLQPLVSLSDERWGDEPEDVSEGDGPGGDGPGGSVWIVPGGSLVTNFAMVQPSGRQLASDLRDQIWDDQRGGTEPFELGFLTSDRQSLPVSRRIARTPPATGLEFMTTWPMSLVTLHGLFVGVVICIALLPIVGRPAAAAVPETGRFSSHLDAVARLLARHDSPDVARGRISRYLRLVRGETSGPGVLPPSDPDSPT